MDTAATAPITVELATATLEAVMVQTGGLVSMVSVARPSLETRPALARNLVIAALPRVTVEVRQPTVASGTRKLCIEIEGG